MFSVEDNHYNLNTMQCVKTNYYDIRFFPLDALGREHTGINDLLYPTAK